MEELFILVVDDYEPARKIALGFLETSGYRTLEASNGAEAIELLQNHAGPIPLLITDVEMPGINGLQLADLAEARRPEIKVLLMSGRIRHTPDDTLGGRGFLLKPFLREEFLRAVGDLLETSAGPMLGRKPNN